MDKPTSNLLNGDLSDMTQKKKIVTDECSTSDSDSEPITTTAVRSVPSSSALSTQKTSQSTQKRRCSDRENFTLPLLKYIGHTAKTLVLTFLFDWSQIIRHPIGSLTTLVIYPLSSGIMVVVSLAFRMGSRFKRGQKKKVHSKIFDENRRPLIERAGHYLDNSLELKVDEITKITHYDCYADNRYKTPSFSIDVAELLLMLSALMYEREPLDSNDKNEGIEYDLGDVADDNNDNIVNGTQAELDESQIKEEENETDSEGRRRDHSILYILRNANKWGLKFYKLSELGTEASPFCGAFYSKEHKFIVVAFKGTTPTDFAEWAVDATFMRTSGKTQLFGE
ncbi:11298_t:CDS:2, partial [Paraglomus occultum]